MKKVILAAMVASTLAGCGTTGGFVNDKSSWVQGSEKVDVALAPEWFTLVLANDDNHIFAVASEYSGDYQFAFDKAMLAAKAELAAQVNNRIMRDTRSFIAENGEGDKDDISRETKRLTHSRVDSTVIVGYKRDKMEVRKEGDGYRVYVRLTYDYSSKNELRSLALKEAKRKAKSEAPQESPDAMKMEGAGVTVTPLPHESISSLDVKERVANTLAKPNAVVITETIR